MFEFEAPDWRALHSSAARRKRFGFCPVGYFLYHVSGRDGYGGIAEDWEYKLYAAKHEVRAAGWISLLWREALRRYFTPGWDFRRGRFDRWVRRNFELRFTDLENQSYLLDPKIVPSVFELTENIFSIDHFYDLVLTELINRCNVFMNSGLAAELMQIPLLDFKQVDDLRCWRLGNINFVNSFDLIWRSGRQLRILDLSQHSYAQEQQRAADLYRVCMVRFLGLSPAQVNVNFLDPQSGDQTVFDTQCGKFEDLFAALSGEAEMWRSYLLRQADVAERNEWLYARKDNCAVCRFRYLCPASGMGTAAVHDGSI